ncbi:DUF2075 domain-containing protein (plasmid) [Lysinibacillus sp. MHQ-1]|nr:DUF2075 domain-containing protein [Lysinibacillus sp. MHQ-1]
MKYTSDKGLEFTEVGCIHVTQGMDLDYAGVIIGNDLDVTEDEEGNIVLIGNPDDYHDTNGIPIKGTDDGSRLTEYIKKVYYILLTRGIHGTFVYIENPKVKNYFKQLIEKKNFSLILYKKVLFNKRIIYKLTIITYLWDNPYTSNYY